MGSEKVEVIRVEYSSEAAEQRQRTQAWARRDAFSDRRDLSMFVNCGEETGGCKKTERLKKI